MAQSGRRMQGRQWVGGQADGGRRGILCGACSSGALLQKHMVLVIHGFGNPCCDEAFKTERREKEKKGEFFFPSWKMAIAPEVRF